MALFTGTSRADRATYIPNPPVLSGFTGGTVTLLRDFAGDTFRAGRGNDTITGGLGADTVFGEGGNDRLTVAVGALALSDLLYGGIGNDSLSCGDSSSRLFGGEGNDTLSGGIFARLEGGDGADRIVQTNSGLNDFNRGFFTGVYYSASASGVNVNLATGRGQGGDAAGDVLVGVRVLHTSRLGDTVTGSAQADSIYGHQGNDQITGGAGDDYILGGTGNDTVRGGTGNDTIIFEAGADRIFGDDGADLLSFDFLQTGGVTVNLTTGVHGGAAAGLTIAGIEQIEGSFFGDTITGNALANRLIGQEGADSLTGGGGNDTLVGGALNDTMSGGPGNDLIFTLADRDRVSGGDGRDTLSFDLLSGGVIVNLANGAASAGFTSVGYDGIEVIILTFGSDTVLSGSVDVEVQGGGGNDSIATGTGNSTIAGGAGNDTLDGGTGADRFVFADSGAADADTLTFTRTDGDTIAISRAGFAAIGPTLTADEFHIGAAATTNVHRLIRDDQGRLWYDRDGTGSAEQALVATVSGDAPVFADLILTA
jgi:Ca2+-binding RTX toxin-like protein